MLDHGQRYRSLIKPFELALDEVWHVGPDEVALKFAQVPSKVADLFAANWCQSEVCNGGFHQFFENSTGVMAPEALKGYRNIGIQQWADLLTTAMAFFGTPYPRDRAIRCSLLPNFRNGNRIDWDPFYDLDNQFYEWLHAEPDRWYRAADSYADRESVERKDVGM